MGQDRRLAQDCDDDSDTAGYTHPGAAESESSTACRKDYDDDGYGDDDATSPIDPGTDCDDDEASTHPYAATHEEDPSLCYQDKDGDGYGSYDVGSEIESGSDCLDANSEAHPGVVFDWFTDDGSGEDEIDADCNERDYLIPSDAADQLAVTSTMLSLSSSGDVDGDGHQDLLFGAYEKSYKAGGVCVVRDPFYTIGDGYDLDDGYIEHTMTPEGAGTSVAMLGDIDGDGNDDFAVGVPSYVSSSTTNASK